MRRRCEDFGGLRRISGLSMDCIVGGQGTLVCVLTRLCELAIQEASKHAMDFACVGEDIAFVRQPAQSVVARAADNLSLECRTGLSVEKSRCEAGWISGGAKLPPPPQPTTMAPSISRTQRCPACPLLRSCHNMPTSKRCTATGHSTIRKSSARFDTSLCGTSATRSE